MKQIITLTFVLIFLNGYSQVVNQIGYVTELNSGKKPIAGVAIDFFGATPTDSDNDGNFSLIFSEKEPGETSFPIEIYKKGYELVNEKELKSITITSNKKFPVNIVMAKAGTLAKMRVEYYEISDSALTANYKIKIKELENNLQQKKISAKQYQEEKELLKENYETQLKNLTKLVERFIRINFDDVSELYKTSFEYFKKGQIDSAVFVLEDADIYQRGLDRIIERERINAALEELQQRKVNNFIGAIADVKALELQRNIYTLKQEYEEEKIFSSAILSLDSLNNRAFNEIINFWTEQKKYTEIIQFYKLVISNTSNPEIKANMWIRIGETHLEASKPDSASLAFLNSYNIFKTIYENNNQDEFILSNLILISERIAANYKNQNRYDKAIVYMLNSVSYSELLYKLDETNINFYSSLGFAYMNLGQLYSETGDNINAKKNYKISRKIFKKSYKKTQDITLSSLIEQVSIKIKNLK